MEPMTATDSAPGQGDEAAEGQTQDELVERLQEAADQAEGDFCEGKQFDDIQEYYEAMGNPTDTIELNLEVSRQEYASTLLALDNGTTRQTPTGEYISRARSMAALVAAAPADVVDELLGGQA